MNFRIIFSRIIGLRFLTGLHSLFGLGICIRDFPIFNSSWGVSKILLKMLVTSSLIILGEYLRRSDGLLMKRFVKVLVLPVKVALWVCSSSQS